MQKDYVTETVLCSISQCRDIVTSHSELPSGAAQIATIGLAASTDVVGVTLGGILGHAICTGAAVIGGRQLSAHIDERMLSVLGGLLFIAFGMHAVWEVRRVPLIILCRHAKLLYCTWELRGLYLLLSCRVFQHETPVMVGAWRRYAQETHHSDMRAMQNSQAQRLTGPLNRQLLYKLATNSLITAGMTARCEWQPC